MASGLKYVIAFASAFALMLAVRTLIVSVHSVTGNGLAPLYKDGDCLLINRCSYGVRIEGNRLLPYSRLMRQPVQRGDIVAFEIPDDETTATAALQPGLMIARCKAIPGDTLRTDKGTVTIPGLANCDKEDCYWLEAINEQNPADSRYLGFIPERCIIGRVVTVLYNRKNIRLQ